MAVVETFSPALLEVTNREKVVNTTGGGRLYHWTTTVPVAAADDDTSKYVVGVVTANERPKDINVFCDEITAGTDYDIGLYRIDSDGGLGAVVDKDLFADGLNLATAQDRLFGLGAPAIENLGKTVRELLVAASITANINDPQYYVVVTANTVGSAAGDITVRYDAIVD